MAINFAAGAGGQPGPNGARAPGRGVDGENIVKHLGAQVRARRGPQKDEKKELVLPRKLAASLNLASGQADTAAAKRIAKEIEDLQQEMGKRRRTGVAGQPLSGSR